MALVTYYGAHPEPSIALPDLGEGRGYGSVGRGFLRGQVVRLESCAFPRGIVRRINPWAAVILAGLRRDHPELERMPRTPYPVWPWFEIRLQPGEWLMIQFAAPWIVKARDALDLVTDEFIEVARSFEGKRYEAFNLGSSFKAPVQEYDPLDPRRQFGRDA